MKNKFRAQLGPRGFVTWVLAVIILAAMMPTLQTQVGVLLPQLDAGSPELFLWSLVPFMFIVGLAAALLYAFLPQKEPRY